MHSLLTTFDLPILEFLNQLAGRNTTFDAAVVSLSRYALFKGALLFSLLWLLWFREDGQESPDERKRRREKLIVVFSATLVAVCLARLLQRFLWIHPRPFHMNLGLKFPGGLDPGVFHVWNSFPSDHAAYFFALAAGLWAVDRRFGLACFLWTALVICLPRVYLGIHHPSDILGGLLIGVAIMAVALRAGLPRALARRILGWGEAHPATFAWLAFLLTVNAATLFDDVRAIATFVQRVLTG